MTVRVRRVLIRKTFRLGD